MKIFNSLQIFVLSFALGAAAHAQTKSDFFAFGPPTTAEMRVAKAADGQEILEFRKDATAEWSSLPIKVIPKGTKLYHWTSNEDFARHAIQSGISAAETKALLSEENSTRQLAAGNGTYVSTAPFDSRNYGRKLIVFETSRDVRLVSDPNYALYLDFQLAYKSKNKLSRQNGIMRDLWSKGIDGDWYSGSWINFANTEPLGKARSGILKDVMDHTIAQPAYYRGSSLSDMAQLYDALGLEATPELQKISPLAYKIVAGSPFGSAEYKEAADFVKYARNAMIPPNNVWGVRLKAFADLIETRLSAPVAPEATH